MSPFRKLPPLNALRAFEAAGRHLNFRAAADELNVTQGAVAQQVRGLENHFGFGLFERLPRGLALTKPGIAYLAEVSRALDILANATSQLQAQPNSVTISVTPTVAAKLLIPRLAQLQAELPEVALRTVATEALSNFDRDQVDIVVRMTQPPFPSDQEAQLLFRHELIAVASPLLVKDMVLPLELEQLQTLPLLHDAHHHWPAFLHLKAPLPGAQFNQTALALDAALAAQGVALTCRAFVASDLEAKRLIQVTATTATMSPDYYLIRKRTSTPNPVVQAVWKWCLKRLSLPETT